MVFEELVKEMETRIAADIGERENRLAKIEEDIATLAGHIGEIRATLAEIATAQQAQARQAAALAGRIAGAEQATSAIQLTMTAYEERVRQVASSMRELRRATLPTG